MSPTPAAPLTPEAHPRRISVIGTSNSGKSTLARELAARVGAPYIELDALYWRPVWTGTPDEEFASAVRGAVAGASWVIDGNYTRIAPIRLARADTLIWLDTSLPRTLARSVRRSLQRARSRQELWPGTGNTESLRRAFLSRDSVILWALTNFHANRRRYDALMASGDYPHLTMVRLRNPREARAYLDGIEPASIV